MFARIVIFANTHHHKILPIAVAKGLHTFTNVGDGAFNLQKKRRYSSTNLKGEIMTRFLLMAIAVPALAMFVTCETASAQHFHGHTGHCGGIAYAAPVYSYAPVYRTAYVQPVYVQPAYLQRAYVRPAYVQPAYGYNSGISISVGRSYGGGSYYRGRPAYIGRQFGGYGHHHHHHHHY